VKRHPENAEGKFWIDQDVCMFCRACDCEAPNNIRFDEIVGMSYLFKQPETDEELEAVRSAISSCPVEAIVEDEVRNEAITN